MIWDEREYKEEMLKKLEDTFFHLSEIKWLIKNEPNQTHFQCLQALESAYDILWDLKSDIISVRMRL